MEWVDDRESLLTTISYLPQNRHQLPATTQPQQPQQEHSLTKSIAALSLDGVGTRKISVVRLEGESLHCMVLGVQEL